MLIETAGRDYFRAYGARRAAEVELLLDAVAQSGGRCIAHTDPNSAPLYLAIDQGDGTVVGILAYLFSAGHRKIKNRPPDEHRLQIKYGDINERFRRQDHSLGFDPAGVDVTVVLGVHEQADLLIGLDPLLYNPLPMGVMVGFKESEVEQGTKSGWHVWERVSRPGRRREDPRATGGWETMVAFAPGRLIDYIAFERQAQTMGLDPALRLRAAEAAKGSRASVKVHDLERAYDLSAEEILEIVSERSRLAMALRGGVAEHHLGRHLRGNRLVAEAEVGHQEGPPDYWVTLRNGDKLTIECKNASPKTYKGNVPKVEIQKTRASKGDPYSRLYKRDAFDVLAVCMYGPTGKWDFRFKRTEDLEPHPEQSDRVYQFQRIDKTWSARLQDVL